MIHALLTEIRFLFRTPLLIIPLVIVSIPLFYNLGAHSIYMWDEAIYANNAIEMLRNGDWFVIMQNGEPSHYNVKPPLVIWLQVLSMGLFGVSEWALRLPSALAGLGIVLLLWVFSRRWFGNYLPGVIASIVLVSALGFTRVHLVRSGDLDAVLLFFTTAYILLITDCVLMRRNPAKYVLPVTLFVLLGFMAKSLGALLPLLPLAIVLLFSPTGRKLLMLKRTWISFFLSAWIVIAYYFARDVMQPGYFRMVWNSEFLRLTHNIMPWHEHPFPFYLVNFLKLDFFDPHLYLVPISIILLLFHKRKFVRRCAAMISGFTFLYLLFISIPVVKLEWYDAPFYPCASLLIGMAVWGYVKRRSILTGIMILVLIFPYRTVLNYYRDHIYPSEPLEREGHFMRQLARDLPGVNTYKVLMQVNTPEHLDQMSWYRKKLNWFAGYHILHVDSLNQVSAIDTILCCQQHFQAKLIGGSHSRILHRNKDCILVSNPTE